MFDPEPMLFDAPEPPPAADTGVDESGEGGAEGATSDASAGSTGEATAGTETDTDTSGAAGFGEELEGCGCRARGTDTGLASLPWLLAPILRRRRRAYRGASIGS